MYKLFYHVLGTQTARSSCQPGIVIMSWGNRLHEVAVSLVLVRSAPGKSSRTRYFSHTNAVNSSNFIPRWGREVIIVYIVNMIRSFVKIWNITSMGRISRLSILFFIITSPERWRHNKNIKMITDLVSLAYLVVLIITYGGTWRKCYLVQEFLFSLWEFIK